eukprot:gene2071-4047_t
MRDFEITSCDKYLGTVECGNVCLIYEWAVKIIKWHDFSVHVGYLHMEINDKTSANANEILGFLLKSHFRSSISEPIKDRLRFADDKACNKSDEIMCLSTQGAILLTNEAIISILKSYAQNLQSSGKQIYCDQLKAIKTSGNGSDSISGVDAKNQNNSENNFITAMVCTTLIEKALFNIASYSEGNHTRLNGTLLKDLLNDVRLSSQLSPGLILSLRTLFLPSGINLRNLIWHGFMAPHELDSRYVLLLVEMLNQLSQYPSVQGCNQSTTITSIQCLEKILEHFHCDELSPAIVPMDSGIFNELIMSSYFIVPGRQGMVRSAMRNLNENNPLLCVLMLLPVLEHGLRLIFAACNNSPQHLMAQQECYYTTLDGFGQRSKHQLLLDPLLRHEERIQSSRQPPLTSTSTSSSPSSLPPSVCVERRNRLPSLLGEGMYALLVDLFMADAGPNVRSRLAHGAEGMTGFGQDELGRRHELCWHKLAEILIALVINYTMSSIIDPNVQLCCDYVERYRSIFHPHAILSAQITGMMDGVESVETMLSERSVEVLTEELQSSSLATACTTVTLSFQSHHRTGYAKVTDQRQRQLALLPLSMSMTMTTDLPSIPFAADKEKNKIKVKPGLSELSQQAIDIIKSLISELYISLTTLRDEEKKESDDVVLTATVLRLIEHFQRTPQSITTLVDRDDGTSDNIAISLSYTTQDMCALRESVKYITQYRLSLLSPPVPHFAACSQLCEVCRQLSVDMESQLSLLEDQVFLGTAHTTQRRRYSTLLLCILPVTIHLERLALGVLICHLRSSVYEGKGMAGSSNPSPPVSRAVERMVLLLSSFLPCIAGDSSSKSTTDTTTTMTTMMEGDKKGVDRALIQLIGALGKKTFSKQIRLLCSVHTENIT